MLMLSRSLKCCRALLLALAPTLGAAQEPSTAPPWSLRTPEGVAVNFPADAEGHPTVLLFWPSWCPFSRALQPYVQDIWVDYREAGVKVWTINIKETGDPVQTMKDRGLSFPLLLAGDPLVHPYRINRTPWLVVIDGSSRIVYTRPPNPPTPIDVAKDVRAALNRLLGDQAVPLPTSYPPPYDLHLKKREDRVDRTAPTPIAEDQWEPWVERYLSGIPADESVGTIEPRGPVPKGKAAIALAKEIWTQAYGAEQVLAQAPYRAFRKRDRWVVLGQGLDRKLGEGLILVIDADSGRVVRMAQGSASGPRSGDGSSVVDPANQ